MSSATKAAAPHIVPSGQPPPDATASGAQRWDDASKEVRQTAKWLVTAYAAVGAVIFGAGPVVSGGDLSGDSLSIRVGLVATCAVVAVFGLASLIWMTARVLVPYEASLYELPEALRARVEEKPRAFLTDDVDTVDQLLDARAKDDRRLKTQTYLLAAAEERLARGREASAPDANVVAANGRKVTEIRQAVATLQGRLADYNGAQQAILGRARYEHVRDIFVGNGRWFVAAGVAAVLGGAGFVLGINYTPTENQLTRPEVAILARHADGSSDDLWAAAGLDACDDPDGRVAVLLDSGKGTAGDPYMVRPVSTDGACAGLRFPVIDQVATVVIAEDDPVEITYQPDDPLPEEAET